MTRSWIREISRQDLQDCRDDPSQACSLRVLILFILLILSNSSSLCILKQEAKSLDRMDRIDRMVGVKSSEAE